jgi:hypothetical protein
METRIDRDALNELGEDDYPAPLMGPLIEELQRTGNQVVLLSSGLIARRLMPSFRCLASRLPRKAVSGTSVVFDLN